MILHINEVIFQIINKLSDQSILQCIYSIEFQSSILSSCRFLLFHGCSLHSLPFFPPRQRERAAFSRSRSRRGGCRTWNSENNVCSVRMLLGNSPTALTTLCSRCVVVCAPPHIWHSGNSSPLKRPPPPPRLVSSGRWRLSSFSAPSFAQ